MYTPINPGNLYILVKLILELLNMQNVEQKISKFRCMA